MSWWKLTRSTASRRGGRNGTRSRSPIGPHNGFPPVMGRMITTARRRIRLRTIGADEDVAAHLLTCAVSARPWPGRLPRLSINDREGTFVSGGRLEVIEVGGRKVSGQCVLIAVFVPACA